MNLHSNTSAISYQHLIPFAETPDPDNETLTGPGAGDEDPQDDDPTSVEDNNAPDPNIKKTDEADNEEEEDFLLSEDEDIAEDDEVRTDEEISGPDGVI
ncbi:hypothetical protein [Hufsiella ginkgonis]|uniref:Uncharacterized protein n=1 Tax=Hufsiella ginkgonis TaxID=2695274 RepID=A0A7K1XYZ6_9SPHI|nr:hypothetical protein [Hufsiella ginkgonis]MXV16221.1 hypothetical protein [Hufsiella ginkgonis]